MIIPSALRRAALRGLALLWFAAVAAAAPAQVINFNYPGGQGGGINYAGQGAYSDPGHSFWNPVVANGTTPGISTNSDGISVSPVTLSERESKGYKSSTPATQGTPEALEYWYADANNFSPQTCALSNVAPGVYHLYLYGKNGNRDFADRGTTFNVWSGGNGYGPQSTSNGLTGAFVRGNDYVVYTNLSVGADGTITFTYAANTAVVRAAGSADYSGTNSQGNFNGLQLVCVSSSPSQAVLTNAAASTVLANSATLGVVVLSTGGSLPVLRFYFGPADGGTSAAGWSNTVSAGYATPGASAVAIANLAPSTTYYFTASASNSAGVSWAAPGSFTTPVTNSAPVYGAPAAPLTLGAGWRMQSAGAVADSGAAISQPGYPAPAWYAATVPGTALTTLVNNGVYPDPLYGTNNWGIPDALCQTSWWYRVDFNLPAAFATNRVWLNVSGLNYAGTIWVNGQNAGSMRGAFTRGTFDVTPFVAPGGSNAVAVLVTPEPNPGAAHVRTVTNGHSNGGVSAADGPTFLCSIGWNWLATVHDRNTGLWRDVTVTGSGAVRIRDPYVTSQLPLPSTNSADLAIEATLTNVTAATQSGTLSGAVGTVVFQRDYVLGPYESQVVSFNAANTPALHIANPQLWWPNGYGAPALYTLQLAATVNGVLSDTNIVTFGIRQIQYHLPGSSNLGLVVNGVPVIVKGGNFGMDEAMKRVPVPRLEAQVRMHQQAGLNMLRNWVGQSTSEEWFSLCDRYGILMWEEFFQPNPVDGPDPSDAALYLANVRDTILRYRNHASIALWCGRNEGDPSPAAVATGVSNLVSTLDPVRWYQPNSASGYGVASSGPYRWQPPENYYSVDTAFKTEIGCGVSVPTLESVHGMIPSNDWEIVNNTWAEHDMTGAPASQGGDVYPSVLAARFGPISGLPDFVRKGQLANYESHRAVFEGRLARMFNPVTGILNWLTSPAHPSFIYQLYTYDLEPNASLFGAQKACEPVHAMLNQSNWHLLVLNCTPQAVAGLTLRTRIFNLDGSLQFAQTNALTAAASVATDLGAVTFPGTLSPSHFVKLELYDSQGGLVSENFYWRETVAGNLQALNSLPAVTPGIAASRISAPGQCVIRVTLTNPAPVVALMTHFQLRRAVSGARVLPVFYSDNYISLLPGESRTVTVQANADDLAGEAPLLAVDGWNIQAVPAVASGSNVAVMPNLDAIAANGAPPAATRINCGGAKSGPGFYQFGIDTNFQADTGYSGGSTATTTSAIDVSAPNAAPQVVYQSLRYGSSFSYTLAAQGTNLVRLHFAETSFGPGGRRFNVAINGQTVLSDFDIAVAGGTGRAVTREFIAAATANSNVVIAFTTGSANQPTICGIEVIPMRAPSAPLNLVAAPGYAQVELDWAPVDQADFYRVKRSRLPGGSVVLVADNVTGTGWVDTGLINGAFYEYTVSAVNSYGESADSAPADAAPQVPVLAGAQSPGGQVVLSWADASNGGAATLYYTPALSPAAVWTPVPNAPVLSGGLWTLTLPVGTNVSGFYRLQ